MKMKQTITFHATSARAMKMFLDYIENAVRDFNDSGESPTGVWYDEEKMEPDVEEKNTG